MSRHTLDRPFDQERFDKLKREAQTVATALRLSGYAPGKVHQKNTILSKLRLKVEKIEDHGEHYFMFDSGPLKGNKIFYTLDRLEAHIKLANRFLEGG